MQVEIAGGVAGDEVASIAFIDDSRLVASLCNRRADVEVHRLALIDAAQGGVLHQVDRAGDSGVLLPVGAGQVLAFHTHPRLIDHRTGELLHEWPDLHTGTQASSIIHHLPPLPPLALHPRRAAFAVADPEKVTVVSLAADFPLAQTSEA